MATTVNTLTAHLQAIMPKGYNTATTPFTTWVTEAIAETMAMAAPEFRERVWFDHVGDGANKRCALPGFDVSLLPVNQWTYPHNQNGTGVADPTTAPTLALRTAGSTIPSGTKLAVAVAWTTPNGGETLLSPFGTITTTAANQTVDVTPVNAPSGTTTCNIYTTIAASAYATLGRAASGVTATAATTGLGLGAATATTLPLYSYSDPTTVTMSEGSVIDGVVDLEFNEDVTGRGLTDLTAAGVQTVFMLDTALALGKALRVWYFRAPQLPAASTTAILGVPDDFLYTGVAAFMHRYLALNHETGAKDQHWAAYLDLHTLLMQMKAVASARATVPARVMQWALQTI